ncbi:Transcription regulator HTH, LysR [Propionibacterium ruminifibrarum]|uniref:Transcription regulator HTH, LysR n=1 Tax=Propionibacterium ruminifibrarum TaxID=1962131 RepID=A0A375I0D3_9ACTN|nr:LysR family transcriptional regulator [Propionibacterium ruminifibrarum]SPF68269.1 Transcription regulator HTH, LysR [Propionibacterium ruminifibrarum]
MLLRQLEYFVAVAHERHFARAAEVCGVSQPTLSDGVRKLEQELGMPLIRRGHTFQGLTPEGSRLVVWAQRMVDDRRALHDAAAVLRSGLSGTLRVGVVPAATTTVARVLDRFCAEHPLVEVHIESMLSTNDIIQQISNYDLDAGICYPVGNELVRYRPLYDETWAFLAPQHMVDEAAESITWAQAASYPLVMLGPTHGLTPMVGAFEASGVTPHITIRTDSVASLFGFVNTGRWASVVPDRWVLDSGQVTDLALLELVEPVVQTRIVLAHRSAEPMSPVVEALVESAVTVCSSAAGAR